MKKQREFWASKFLQLRVLQTKMGAPVWRPAGEVRSVIPEQMPYPHPGYVLVSST